MHECTHPNIGFWDEYCDICDDYVWKYSGITDHTWHTRDKDEPSLWSAEPIDAAKYAVAKAEIDLEEGIYRYLTYGGPGLSSVGRRQDYLRELGLRVEAVTGCETTPGIETYVTVYNAVMSSVSFTTPSGDSERIGRVLSIVSSKMPSAEHYICMWLSIECKCEYCTKED